MIVLSVRVQWKVHEDQIYYAFCMLSHICVTNLHCSVPTYSEVEMLPRRSAVPIRLVYRLTVIGEKHDTKNLKNNFDLENVKELSFECNSVIPNHLVFNL